MPITQDRMITIVKAGRKIYEALEDFQAQIGMAAKAADNHQELLDLLHALLQKNYKLERAFAEIIAEEGYFKRFAKSNDASRMRQAAARQRDQSLASQGLVKPERTVRHPQPAGPPSRQDSGRTLAGLRQDPLEDPTDPAVPSDPNVLAQAGLPTLPIPDGTSQVPEAGEDLF